MWATIGVALKKIAVSLLTNPKVLKVVGGIALGIIIIIIMPVIAVVSVFNGSVEIDTNKLQQYIQDNVTAEHEEQLKLMEDTMTKVKKTAC